MLASGQKRTSTDKLLDHFVGEPNSARGTAILSTFTFKQVQSCLPVLFVSSLSLGVVTSSNVTKVNRGGLAYAIVIRHSCRAGCFDRDVHRARHRRLRRQRQHPL